MAFRPFTFFSRVTAYFNVRQVDVKVDEACEIAVEMNVDLFTFIFPQFDFLTFD